MAPEPMAAPELAPEIGVEEVWRSIVGGSASVGEVAGKVAAELVRRVGVASTALQGQVVVAAFLGQARLECPGSLTWDQVSGLVDDLFQDVVAAVAAGEALAVPTVLWVLTQVAPAGARAAATQALAPRADTLVPALPWAREGRSRFVGATTWQLPSGVTAFRLHLAEGPAPFTVTVQLDSDDSAGDLHVLDETTHAPAGPDDAAQALDVDAAGELLARVLARTPRPGDAASSARLARSWPVLESSFRAVWPPA